MTFTVLVIGSGGREHAICWRLSQSESVETIFIVPGNGGTRSIHKVVQVTHLPEKDYAALVAFAVENKVDLVIPGPELPLVEGIEEHFRKAGIYCFGPSKKAARIEGSKAFAKDFMLRHCIPTATHKTFVDLTKALEYLEDCQYPLVLKASGLATGKGVLLPETKEEAIEGVRDILERKIFGSAGEELVVEEFLKGTEVSVLAISDGYTVIPFPAAQDHKRAFNDDLGPNTGGMGCVAPTTADLKAITAKTLKPAVDGMRKEGFPFVGILFAGLMLTDEGPKVLEYNCRFGDPETQTLLPLLKGDFGELLMAAVEHRLDSFNLEFNPGFCATVIAASGGYPEKYQKGYPITLPQSIISSDVMIFHAGTAISSNDELVTAGGRVLAITATGETLDAALEKAYETLSLCSFDKMRFRSDIGKKQRQTQRSKITYADSGVSIDRGNLLVKQISTSVKQTMRPGADAELGGFGGLFDLKAAGYSPDCLLVSATDGVGTKLMLAHATGIHHTIGQDLVAMNVNDLVVQAAEPLYFLDYYACGRLDNEIAAKVVQGIAKACKEAGCALIGGETSEMPGLYENGIYDLAGFAVGAVERINLLPKPETMKAGDVLIGLASSGLHSNGYSLVRRLLKLHQFDLHAPPPFSSSAVSLAQVLLEPTRIYVKQLLPLLKSPHKLVKGLAHITGGGLLENIPRVLPPLLKAVVNVNSLSLPPVFTWIKELAALDTTELFRTFNCGIGMVLVVSPDNVDSVQKQLKELGEQTCVIGSLQPNDSNLAKVELL